MNDQHIGFRLTYFFIISLELIGDYQIDTNQMLRYMTKPMLCIVLMLWYLHSTWPSKDPIDRLLLRAIVFSLFGDILLMFASNNDSLFLSGLISFLTAHIWFIGAFLYTSKETLPWWFIGKKSALPTLLLLIFSAAFDYWLFPYLGSLWPAIVIYSLVICRMAIGATNRYNRVPFKSYRSVLIGALLFVISDSALAVSNFAFSFTGDRLVVMLTYALAQYFIVNGIIKQQEGKIEEMPVAAS